MAAAPEDRFAHLAERVITAEQDERRRLAIFLHDGPVQHLSGIALMLDAALGAIDAGSPDDARTILAAALDRHRATIRELRDLSFNIEPVVLRDQGFDAAVRALADQVGLEQGVRIELDVAAGNRLGEQVQVGLYQIIRESLTQAIRRGPPTSISVRLGEVDGSDLELVIEDDGSGERRKASLDSLGERAATLNARFSVEQPPEGGTRVHVVLPAYAAGAGGE
jgi:signal transduction histidine kinase